MIDVSGVRFKKTGKIYYFDPRDIDTKIGDNVIVETSRGIEYGTVVIKKELKEEEILTELKPVLRIASPEDDLRQLDNRNDAREALIICENKCKEHKLNMKLIGCEYTFDRGKLLFYFTADGRIDFRELVRDLASIFRTRIELRQIGVRDEAKKIGGLGPCGRPCCCRAFLSEFSPVSIKMAKDQELSLNPTKISGLCGRLMCCLKYEQDGYECIFKKMPRLGEFVMTDRGEGTVIDKYTIQELVKIQFQNGEDIEVEIRDLDQIKRSGKMNKNFTQLNSSLKDEEVRESELKDLEE
ncbi:cell fate regulator YaaT (PSP1 superfamily) [Peptoniphilus koenoeneniae]|uniref:Cell fate regulator YaaT (PSP1 superfamily) n=1 Tax=Peptoniphilus koenoeneniae TaxID=507751 RepID=A0ABU0AW18_9FIRM|nr:MULTISPECIES: stage 0 sporulation family protein [Peptoniphilus]ERT57525.1 PSP1 C-terminal domain protein [Peptoniphilus sp. BV3C26]MDQ0275462.1 cell fate regulator YaaT (PSP1 superfamily) [Peptoniphilus koenoeneniae]